MSGKNRKNKQAFNQLQWVNDMWFRRKKSASMPPSKPSTSSSDHEEVSSFSFSDVQSATENFSPHKKLEDGQFGEIYKGELSDGTKLSVKKLSQKYYQRERDAFVSEVSTILAADHQNLVKLMGFCAEANNQILLYEFLEQHRPLSEILFSENEAVCLNWNTRYMISTAVSRGLVYLHDKANLVHGDIRASNILVDADFRPKIADVGLTNLLPEGDSHVNARIAGTFGYMAPEYAIQGKLTDKVDVYSFGVVLLELISGRNNIDLSLPMERICLLEWAWRLYTQGRVLELVDPRLRGDYPQDIVFRALHIALLCTQESAKSRPSMVQTSAMLTGDWEISVFPSKPGLLAELYQ